VTQMVTIKRLANTPYAFRFEKYWDVELSKFSFSIIGGTKNTLEANNYPIRREGAAPEETSSRKVNMRKDVIAKRASRSYVYAVPQTMPIECMPCASLALDEP